MPSTQVECISELQGDLLVPSSPGYNIVLISWFVCVSVWLSVIQCSGSQIVCCMDIKLGMRIDLDDILDKYYDQGHGSRLTCWKKKLFSTLRWVDLCRFTFSCHVMSHGVTTRCHVRILTRRAKWKRDHQCSVVFILSADQCFPNTDSPFSCIALESILPKPSPFIQIRFSTFVVGNP